MPRDFIPEGSPLTPAEQDRVDRAITRRGDSFVKADFIPDPANPTKKDLSREEKAARAQARAFRAAQREQDEAVPLAQAKLRKMSATDAADFVSTLSSADKRTYARAEFEDQGRATVLRKLKAYLPESPKE